MHGLDETKGDPEGDELGEGRECVWAFVADEKVVIGAEGERGEGGPEERTDDEHALELVFFITQVDGHDDEHAEDAEGR